MGTLEQSLNEYENLSDDELLSLLNSLTTEVIDRGYDTQAFIAFATNLVEAGFDPEGLSYLILDNFG
jgi:hypothetical protein